MLRCKFLPLLLLVAAGCGGSHSGTTPVRDTPAPDISGYPTLGVASVDLRIESVSGPLRDTTMIGTGAVHGSMFLKDEDGVLTMIGRMGRLSESGWEYLWQAMALSLPHVGDLTTGATFTLSTPTQAEYGEGLTWLAPPVAGDGMGQSWQVVSGTVTVADATPGHFTLQLTDVVLSTSFGTPTYTVKVNGTLSGSMG